MRVASLSPALLLGLSLATACTSYQALADPVAELATYPSQVGPARVTLRNGKRIKFASLQVEGDSLKGFLDDGGPSSIALADVEMVELRREDVEKTQALTDAVMCTIFSALGGDCESEDTEE